MLVFMNNNHGIYQWKDLSAKSFSLIAFRLFIFVVVHTQKRKLNRGLNHAYDGKRCQADSGNCEIQEYEISETEHVGFQELFQKQKTSVEGLIGRQYRVQNRCRFFDRAWIFFSVSVSTFHICKCYALTISITFFKYFFQSFTLIYDFIENEQIR